MQLSEIAYSLKISLSWALTSSYIIVQVDKKSKLCFLECKFFSLRLLVDFRELNFRIFEALALSKSSKERFLQKIVDSLKSLTAV